ncbi:c-type cytochrome [Pelomonas sp. KK5]|uniref:c-type cytochrome n=1 Tax=Pelomonas sp. KK5 TaxID=1855730 RepID=UPI00097C4FB4|nr:c-type cytochrome [Pelomonas sp. KK5]
MSSSRNFIFALALASVAATAQTPRFDGIGRTATPAEVKAWDIDVRPDFKGLPPGRGTVAQGQDLWEAKCAGCHGVFGESNEVFSALVGGTTADDIKTGHVKRLTDPSFPGRTTLMKVSHISTLFDYIQRAMPWTAPKSLKPDEVYAVTAYLLSLADVLPADGELSDRNIAEVQQRLPNRNGKTWDHAMWPGKEFSKASKPDVQGSSCMTNCATEPKVASLLPDFAMNAHGNLSQQQRLVGPQRGLDTAPKAAAAKPAAQAAAPAVDVAKLLTQHACFACHQIDAKLVGPAFKDVAAKYKDRPDAREYFASRIRSGSSGNWGTIPMPAQEAVSAADLTAIAAWLAGGAGNQ